MKKILIGIAAIATLGATAPAAAQYRAYNDNGIENRIGQLQNRLQAGVQRGTITRGEAVQLRERLRQLRQIERQFSRNGLTRGERDNLQQRIRNLQQQIKYAERNGNDRFDRDGRYDRDDDRRDRDDRWDRRDRDDDDD